MKMQEVILRLRELAPGVATNVRSANIEFDTMRMILMDASHATSYESVKALVNACLKKADLALCALEKADTTAKELNDVNLSYKERLGSRAKKPGDDPGQMELDLGEQEA